MARIILANITQRGTQAAFMEAMATAPNVYKNHCMEVPSDAPDENYVWMGTAPKPRVFSSGREFQGMRDFAFTVTNEEYELSFIVDQNTIEDDRHGMVQQRIREVANVWATYYDDLFAQLLEAGTTSTATFDGVAYHIGTRTIGASGTIDNTDTSDIVTTTNPTSAEVLIALNQILTLMWGYQDDQGRAGFNSRAMSKLRAIIQPGYQKGFVEAMNSTLLTQTTATGVFGTNDNPWGKGLVEIDVLPYLTAASVTFYTSAVGDVRMPFLFQKRTDPQVEVFNDSKSVADNHGIKVLTRQRFKFAYGEPRRNVKHIFT